jgi:hypothetical protein
MLAIEYEPNIQENINQIGGDILTKTTELLEKLKEQKTFMQESTDTDSSNNSYFNATMLIIEKSPKIECISYDSLYGFIFKIEVPTDYQFFEYFDYATEKTQLTHILLKVIICNDNPGPLKPLKIGTNKPGVEGMVNVSIDLMSQIITGKSNNPNIKTHNKQSENINSITREVRCQQDIFKKTVQTGYNYKSGMVSYFSPKSAGPSVLDFFWMKSDADSNLINTLIKEQIDSPIKSYILDSLSLKNNSIGCITMEYAGQGPDNFTTFHQFIQKYKSNLENIDTIKKLDKNPGITSALAERIKYLIYFKSVILSIFSQIIKIADSGYFHSDLHANNIFINLGINLNEDIQQQQCSKTETIITLIKLDKQLTYILDFGQIDTIDNNSNMSDKPPFEIITIFLSNPKRKRQSKTLFDWLNIIYGVSVNEFVDSTKIHKITCGTETESTNSSSQSTNSSSQSTNSSNQSKNSSNPSINLTKFINDLNFYYNLTNQTANNLTNQRAKNSNSELINKCFDETKITNSYEATLSGGDQSITDVSELITNATNVLSNVSVDNSQKTVATQSIDLPNKAIEILNSLITPDVATPSAPISKVNQPIDLPNKAIEILNNLITPPVVEPVAPIVNPSIDLPNTAMQILNSLIQPSVSSPVAATIVNPPIVNPSIDLPNTAIEILNNLISQSVATSKVNQPIDLPNTAMQILNNLISQSVAAPSATTSEVNKSIDLPNTAMQILNSLIQLPVAAPIVNHSNIASGTGTEHIKISSYELDEQNQQIQNTIQNKFLTFDPSNKTFVQLNNN